MARTGIPGGPSLGEIEDGDSEQSDTGPGAGGTGIPGAPSDQQPDTGQTAEPDGDGGGSDGGGPDIGIGEPDLGEQDFKTIAATDPETGRETGVQVPADFGAGDAVIVDGQVILQPEDGGTAFAVSEQGFKERVTGGLESSIEEQVGFDVQAGDDFTIRREGDTFVAEPTSQLARRSGARIRGAIGPALGDPAGFSAEQIERRRADIRGAIGGLLGGLGGPSAEQTERRRAGRIERAVLAEGDVSRPSGGFLGARGGMSPTDRAKQEVLLELSQQVGEPVDPGDIEFSISDGTVSGRLGQQAQTEVRVQQEPLVQLTSGTPLGGLFETGATIGAQQEVARARRRRRLFSAIGQRDRTESVLRDLGLGGAIDSFRGLQEDAQAGLESLRSDLFTAGGNLVDEQGAKAAFLLSAPVTVPLETAGVDVTDTGVPDPRESPEEFIAAAAPAAAIEPTPFGEVALGLAAGGAGALAASERVDRDVAAPAQAEATAEVPGLFVPEIEQPEEAIGRGFFPADMPIGPTRRELPELLPPTDPKSSIRTGRLTRPELEVPDEPGLGTFPAEVPVPEKSGDAGLFPPEQEVPTVETAPQQIGRQRERLREVDEDISRALERMQTNEELRRRRRRSLRDRRERRRQRQVDEILEGDFPASPRRGEPAEPADQRTIEEKLESARERRGEGREEFLERLRKSGEQTVEPGGLQFIVRPDPSSMDLRRIETEEGEFVVGPELTRFLEAAELELLDEPELASTQQAATLPPGEDTVTEMAILDAAAEAAAQRSIDRTATEPLAATVVDDLLRADVAVTPESAQDEATDEITINEDRLAESVELAETTATTTPDVGASYPVEFVEQFEEPPRFPEETVTETGFPGGGRKTPIPDLDRIEEEVLDEENLLADELFESGIADVEAAESIEERILGGEAGGRRSPDDIEGEILDN